MPARKLPGPDLTLGVGNRFAILCDGWILGIITELVSGAILGHTVEEISRCEFTVGVQLNAERHKHAGTHGFLPNTHAPVGLGCAAGKLILRHDKARDVLHLADVWTGQITDKRVAAQGVDIAVIVLFGVIKSDRQTRGCSHEIKAAAQTAFE